MVFSFCINVMLIIKNNDIIKMNMFAIIGGIMGPIIIILILVLIILLILIVGFFYIKSKISSFSMRWFGSKDIINELKNRKQELEEEPKTPYGMDNLLLPEISKDFPNMNLNEMKKVAEENIISYFKSLEEKKYMINNNCSDLIKDKIAKKIDEIRSKSISFESIDIHKTVINQYSKDDSICKLVFQTALGYRETFDGKSNLREERMNTEFIYIYDTKNISGNDSISLKCPNCGAPIPGLGHKICPYCKAGLIDLAPKTWKLNDISKIG